MPLSVVHRWEDRVLVCGPTWFAYRGCLRLAFLFDALKAVDLFKMIGENWKNSSSKGNFSAPHSPSKDDVEMGPKERNKTAKAVYGYLTQ
jgi:hypothetical protein